MLWRELVSTLFSCPKDCFIEAMFCRIIPFLHRLRFLMIFRCGLPFLYAAEVTPLYLRHVGSALSVGMEWLMTFVVVKACLSSFLAHLSIN